MLIAALAAGLSALVSVQREAGRVYRSLHQKEGNLFPPTPEIFFFSSHEILRENMLGVFYM